MLKHLNICITSKMTNHTTCIFVYFEKMFFHNFSITFHYTTETQTLLKLLKRSECFWEWLILLNINNRSGWNQETTKKNWVLAKNNIDFSNSVFYRNTIRTHQANRLIITILLPIFSSPSMLSACFH